MPRGLRSCQNPTDLRVPAPDDDLVHERPEEAPATRHVELGQAAAWPRRTTAQLVLTRLLGLLADNASPSHSQPLLQADPLPRQAVQLAAQLVSARVLLGIEVQQSALGRPQRPQLTGASVERVRGVLASTATTEGAGRVPAPGLPSSLPA